MTEKEFTQLRESAVALSPRLARFIRYLESYPANSRVRKPGSR
jgi:hypothetical protein